MESVAICGGGNIAHSLAATLSRYLPVQVLTRRPAEWASALSCEQAGLTWQSSFPIRATAKVDDLTEARTVFVALPQFAVEEAVFKLCIALKAGATVVFVPAPAKCEEYSKKLLAHEINAVGFQRVPFISRIIEYGRSVSISAPRTIHKLVLSNRGMADEWQGICRNLFGGDIAYLSSFLSFAFSNSNPLLHPSRLMILLQQPFYLRKPLFYAEWTDESSELYVESDREMLAVMRQCPDVDVERDYESVIAHYGGGGHRWLDPKNTVDTGVSKDRGALSIVRGRVVCSRLVVPLFYRRCTIRHKEDKRIGVAFRRCDADDRYVRRADRYTAKRRQAVVTHLHLR